MHLSGKLNQAGSPATGEHEFQFRLFTSATGDTIVPKTQTIVTSENVTAGNWQTALDLRRFGGEKSLLDNTVIPANEAVSLLDNTVTPAVGERALLDNTVRTAMHQSWRAIEGNWLEISVRRKGTTTFVPLLPRQKLGSVPRASTAFSAEHAAVAGSVTEGGVDNRSIAPGAITADKLAPVSISTGALQDLGVTGSKIAPAAITADKLAPVSISTGALQDLGVTSSKIAPAAITADKLAPVSIGTGALQDLGVTGAKIAPQTVVRSLNGLRDDVTLAAGQGIALGGQGSVITITATGGGGTPALPHGNALGGGLDNTFGGSAYYGFLGGGEHNKISDANYDSFLGGGKLNVIYERSGSSTLAGGEFNTISTDSPSSVIGGGSGNTVAGELATVLSGQNNTASAYSTVAGGVLNKTENSYATVPGGFQNRASGVASFAAGYNARALHSGAFVWSGFGGNGPFSSSRDGEFAVSAPGGVRFTTGGRGFTVDGVSVTPGGGGGNGWSQAGNAGTDPATAFLGTTDAQPLNFRVNNSPALRIEQRTDANPPGTRTGMNVIFNPAVNNVNPPTLAGVMVGGGGTVNGQIHGNRVESSFSTIAGGRLNVAGDSSDSRSTDAFVGGGLGNHATGKLSVIGGGNENYAGSLGSILGGLANIVDADGSVIGAGNLNNIIETRSQWRNYAHYAGILGGQVNLITNSFYSFIGGGQSNRIQEAADGAVISGGRNNESWGADSVIPGGRYNYAQGTASFAAGTDARALHAGAFVWNDTGGGTFTSLRDNEFAVRARGGIRLDTGGQGLLVDGVPVVGSSGNVPLTVITAGGQTQPQARLEQTNPDDYVRLMMNTPRSFWTVGTGPNGWFTFYVPGQSPANTTGDNGAHRFVITANGEVGVGSQQPLAQFHVRGHGGFDLPQARFTQENPQDAARVRLETGAKAWDIAASPDGSLRFFSGTDRVIMDANGGLSATVVNQTSDRNAKRGFKPVNVKEVLAKVAAMPISEWQFKNDAQGSRHVGPMAQDFHAAFGVGATETQIATVDADGVALAAIQGLHQEGLEKDERIRELEQQVRRLDEIVRKLAAHQP